MGIGHSTHIPVLLKVLPVTTGSVLELGVGTFSTTILHYICMNMNRMLVSLDNDIKYVNSIIPYSTYMHRIEYIEDWDQADILKPWSVVFIDHSPGSRRGVDAGRLSQFAEYVICHDSEPKCDKIYEYSKIYTLFKYRWEYTRLTPHTVVLSNVHNLDWMEG